MCDRVVLTRGKFSIPAAETRRSEAATVTQSARDYSELWQPVRIQVASAWPLVYVFPGSRVWRGAFR
jgi:hypothetical protein